MLKAPWHGYFGDKTSVRRHTQSERERDGTGWQRNGRYTLALSISACCDALAPTASSATCAIYLFTAVHLTFQQKGIASKICSNSQNDTKIYVYMYMYVNKIYST